MQKKIMLLSVALVFLFVFACGDAEDDTTDDVTPQVTSTIKGTITNNVPDTVASALQLKLSLFEIVLLPTTDDTLTATAVQTAHFVIPGSTGTTDADSKYVVIPSYITYPVTQGSTTVLYLNATPYISSSTTNIVVNANTDTTYSFTFTGAPADTQVFGLVAWMDSKEDSGAPGINGRWNFGKAIALTDTNLASGNPTLIGKEKGSELAGFYMSGAFQYINASGAWAYLDIANGLATPIKTNTKGFDIVIDLP